MFLKDPSMDSDRVIFHLYPDAKRAYGLKRDSTLRYSCVWNDTWKKVILKFSNYHILKLLSAHLFPIPSVINRRVVVHADFLRPMFIVLVVAIFI